MYRKLGFQVTREFNYFRQKNEAVTTNDKIPEISCVVRPIDLKEHNSIPTFWDFSPSWQNSLESIQRTPHDFISLGAFAQEEFTGYCVFEPASGDITQLAVNKANRHKGIATLLLKEVI